MLLYNKSGIQLKELQALTLFKKKPQKKKKRKEKASRDFPSGPVVKNPPCNAGDAGLIPGQGTKIPHVSRQLSLSATTIEPKYHNKKIPHDPSKIPPQPNSK